MRDVAHSAASPDQAPYAVAEAVFAGQSSRIDDELAGWGEHPRCAARSGVASKPGPGGSHSSKWCTALKQVITSQRRGGPEWERFRRPRPGAAYADPRVCCGCALAHTFLSMGGLRSRPMETTCMARAEPKQ